MLSNALADTTLNDELNALKICTFEDVKDVRLLAVPRRVVGVCSGKFSKEESEELLGIFDATGSFDVPKEQMKKMPEVGVPLELKATPFTESETNSYAMVCFCNGDDSDKYSAINVILKAALQEHLYHELRLKAQLGYDFDLTLHLSSVMRGLHIYVVSPIEVLSRDWRKALLKDTKSFWLMIIKKMLV
ncbi:Peptidase M16 C-terminal [Arabidopsis thaliana x Arabidopsis arenosa]|uniref:Peptidase M16 C-terminal n=1 Tax=Arabidopsis thaliana x Arabidopsis arenosa TaxID=1240361 RepID=A0A8T2BFY6_9BRAS|nr:Peptidase M16 C-terminal [Arabidopsis thaliana x Arabidopsis arenosa]KAG7586209.1 Peptidase M16 C-terminal [Arabidopsis thaliana x Arabidopsis arenosa]